MLATVAVGGGSRQRRVGEGHLGVVRDSVNTLLQFCFVFFSEWRNSAVFDAKLAVRELVPRGPIPSPEGQFRYESPFGTPPDPDSDP